MRLIDDAPFGGGGTTESVPDHDLGTPLVHLEHGVGRFDGLTRMELGGSAQEFVTLRYAGDDKLHVPVHALHLVAPFGHGDDDEAPLHALGREKRWHEAREAAAEQAAETAVRLLRERARRAKLEAPLVEVAPERLEEFGTAFGHELTPDQAGAVVDVLGDLASGRPMDRVVCGDVGFGKTEVAMRAAFAAIEAGLQVAVAAPTTVLCRQHLAKFVERFERESVNVASLCGHDDEAGRTRTLEGLADGSVDIVVGTHAVLDESVRFDHLGLVVIDEEHRFGVAHKERAAALRGSVHVLSLTATPIPRTLGMGLAGVRDLSVIRTAPEGRVPVRTRVAEHDAALGHEAVAKELARGGQAFWLHNRIESIEAAAEALRAALPDADVRVAHGDLDDDALDAVMRDFADGAFDVLVATTLIESGIDVPNANTMVIERADLLGLAQLHQLRGRVGRSDRQGHAVLLHPPAHEITPAARRRLDAIGEATGLGAGLELARADLDIRGVGELLGEAQTGRVADVGLAFYSELLSHAIGALERGGVSVRSPELDAPTVVELGAPPSLCEADVPDAGARLAWYLRIASAPDAGRLDELRGDLVDEIGPLSPDGARTFELARVRLACRRFGIAKLELGPGGGTLALRADSPIDRPALEAIAAHASTDAVLEDERTLRFASAPAEPEELMRLVNGMLDGFDRRLG